ncbi:hypothetical protein Y1Q_0016358 [Alligator mississippiensis]|uniref:Uncharacterized protein n=1 Tax=Alligator mississippiensis TaxID=8496 RepID=A0A151N2G5_ALLMI|nr:hypothetical protein Y1Q_0016358 [Alligator mississippiensis]
MYMDCLHVSFHSCPLLLEQRSTIRSLRSQGQYGERQEKEVLSSSLRIQKAGESCDLQEMEGETPDASKLTSFWSLQEDRQS